MWKYTSIAECNNFLLSLNLINCKDSKKYIKTIYSISNNIVNNYKVFKIKKRNGKLRTIYEPSNVLKHIQKKILENVLETRKISSFATAYYKGLSLSDNCLPHINKKIILKLDIKDFFNNISFYNVYNSCFPIEYYPKSIGMLLTNLCTYNGYLIQGAPTSSYISNLVMRDFDENIGNWCLNNNISYTRYSDDMTFSGNFDPSLVIKKVKNNLLLLGLELNEDKIHVITRNKSQRVTGIVVNEKIQVCTKYRKQIRAEVYYIKKYGLKSHLNKIKSSESEIKYFRSLYGKVLYILSINPNDKEFINYKDYLNKIKKELILN